MLDVQLVDRLHKEEHFVENRLNNSSPFKCYGYLFMLHTFSYESSLP